MKKMRYTKSRLRENIDVAIVDFVLDLEFNLICDLAHKCVGDEVSGASAKREVRARGIFLPRGSYNSLALAYPTQPALPSRLIVLCICSFCR